MKTEVIKIDQNNMDTEALERAAAIIRDGGLVAFPTETVYGLGADALSAEASKKIYAAKGRPSDNPLIAPCGRIFRHGENRTGDAGRSKETCRCIPGRAR